MRLPRTSLPIVGLLFAGLLIASLACAESIKILVQSSPLAGSQYYAAAKIWNNIKQGDRLTLTSSSAMCRVPKTVP